MQQEPDRKSAFRFAISRFIEERREAKLKGLKDDAAAEAAGKYDYTTWLADAARRVTQIQAVTHVLKATHPDARGSSLHIQPQALTQHSEIGSHLLGADYADDIVGNAAALDVYKFLKVEVEGKRLLDWLQAGDSDLLAALHNDPATATQWADAFKGLVRTADKLASHSLAKQLYWHINGKPSDDAGYHLLQPLFASSLAHAVHHDINDARFGETNKLARQAKRDGKAHDAPYSDYRNLVVRKLGGTKPQNISQLNSERGGVNYLLASLPPAWDQNRPRHVLFIESALPRFARYEGVPELINALLTLLKSNPDPTMDTRKKRERIERALGESLAAFGTSIHAQLEPGWTRDADCRLPLFEQLWLDPNRADLPTRPEHEDEDLAFKTAYEFKDWADQVAHRFGLWLNAILAEHKLPVGDAEHAHWARQALIDVDWPAPMQRRRAGPASITPEVLNG
ncbi:type I-F CRISPR-associated protein Csy1 [Pseudomonas sp. 5P_3.1_Bac2]|uniref:type I-F CRISPR-associated protein Csy1 n=1 Tax=Pseudomonas sp. 5P_3.1_Bac2 TaxID=2971617 RepID=UPI0021C5B182|nr:type I-F CRISPR-associated protein Csy1 [Pseudomonas sp. 5P_3.1_Bac2]MCU1718627.1 type I-F CRISPR-associated protein Csy1 [Pseudomonas sp. 5P_3.1_Bac2]